MGRWSEVPGQLEDWVPRRRGHRKDRRREGNEGSLEGRQLGQMALS